ncbi:MAG: energy-coupling factor transporter ATPase [Candidatus Spyradocola sp.]|nr:energy-coupling factor transporter ATPase [Candidatus Spyradocola sp.]
MPVEARELTHTYNADSPFESTALDKVSFTIHDGEFIGIIGHTGSGKSTLIQHLNGLLKPTGGTVIVNGMDLTAKGTNMKEVRRTIGLVFQYPEYQLFEETVEKDIAFGPKNLGLDEKKIATRVRDAMRLVDLDYAQFANKSPFELSGGQKRRVAIAGVLAMEPDILILDEPTAGLDPYGRDYILGLVENWHKLGRTILMVSHSMDDVARFADRIFVMNHGKLEMQGTPDEVFAQEERLRAMGLDVPAVTTLAGELSRRGFDLPRHIHTMDEMERALVGLLGGEKHA